MPRRDEIQVWGTETPPKRSAVLTVMGVAVGLIIVLGLATRLMGPRPSTLSPVAPPAPTAGDVGPQGAPEVSEEKTAAAPTGPGGARVPPEGSSAVGVWELTRISPSGTRIRYYLELAQSGTELRGTLGGLVGERKALVFGEVKGNQVRMETVGYGNIGMRFSGTITGTRMAGTVEMVAEGTGTDTWEASQISGRVYAPDPFTGTNAVKAEADDLLQAVKTLSWVYYQEHDRMPSSLIDINFTMWQKSAWNAPVLSAGGGSASSITWTVRGNGTKAATGAHTCSITFSADGSSSAGCNF